MNIVILGNNAGAHFLAQHLLGYSNVKNVYHAAPNREIPETDRYHPIPVSSLEENKKAILEISTRSDIDLVIPMATHFQLWRELYNKVKAAGIPLLMPSRDIGMLEFSKVIGKKFLQEAGVPTPLHRSVAFPDLLKEFFNIPRPFVLKYDQDWRAGKQTIIITDNNYQQEYDTLVTEGDQRHTVMLMGQWTTPNFAVEEYVEGVREYSYHAVCNKTGWRYIGSARDYKRRFDGDIGHNTAGMGAYAPVDIDARVHTYVDKILALIKSKGWEYVGIMYLGIMVTKDGTPIVLEINTRFGDPESQTLLPLIANNLPDLLYAAASNAELPEVMFSNKSAVSVRVVHEDYDSISPTQRDIPDMLHGDKNVCLSHNSNRNLFCSVATSTGNSIEEARDAVYNFLDKIDMKEFTYRKDIGYKL